MCPSRRISIESKTQFYYLYISPHSIFGEREREREREREMSNSPRSLNSSSSSSDISLKGLEALEVTYGKNTMGPPQYHRVPKNVNRDSKQDFDDSVFIW